jgi:hypothetical protein
MKPKNYPEILRKKPFKKNKIEMMKDYLIVKILNVTGMIIEL